MAGRRFRSASVVAALVMIAAGTACSPVPPLLHTFPSSSALASSVLDAVARKDRARLDLLAINEQEFRDHVWPKLPASRPERNLPLSYVWGDLRQKSNTALAATLARYGGQPYSLVAIDFAEQTDYGTYRVHRDGTLRVRDANGTETALRVFGSMLEMHGAWKIFSYVTD